MAKIRVLLADGHKWVRQGLHDFLESAEDISVVAEAGDGLQMLVMFERCQPDITILDVALPVVGGLSAIKAIRGIEPHARIILLTAFEEYSDISLLTRLDAEGYLAKSCDMDVLQEAVRAVHHGGMVFKPTLRSSSLV